MPLGDFFGVGHGRTTNFVSAAPADEPGGRQGAQLLVRDAVRRRRADRADQRRPRPGRRSSTSTSTTRSSTPSATTSAASTPSGAARTRPPASASAGAPTRGSSSTAPTSTAATTTRSSRPRATATTSAASSTSRTCAARGKWNWYGEGDDMIFIDGDEWPPTLHGTGTEDYVNTAWCPTQSYSAPYHGVTLPGGTQLVRPGQPLPLPRRGPGRLRALHPRDHRARPRQPAQRRLVLGRLLVSGRAPSALRPRSGGATTTPTVSQTFAVGSEMADQAPPSDEQVPGGDRSVTEGAAGGHACP